MCNHENDIEVLVKIQADLSCSGEERWAKKPIDACIAQIVQALQEGGIDMRGSCCGHGKTVGDIHLQDGRVLLVLSKDDGEDYMAASATDRPAIVAAAVSEITDRIKAED